MQVEQRTVRKMGSDRNATVTFYKLREGVKSGMIYRAEMRGQMPIFVYKIKGSTKVQVVCAGQRSRVYTNAKSGFAAMARTCWGLIDPTPAAFGKGDVVSTKLFDGERGNVTLTSGLKRDTDGKLGYDAKLGKTRMFIYSRFVRAAI
jgi:hypothetical protein